MHPRFHLAFPVIDLGATRRFYGELLGCKEGRSAERWVDFDFFGHQISAHLISAHLIGAHLIGAESSAVADNPVDGDAVPARHFGVILPWKDWETLRDKLLAARVVFRIAPRVRFAGQVGEQATMFFDDPSGNAIELKAFRDPDQIFAR